MNRYENTITAVAVGTSETMTGIKQVDAISLLNLHNLLRDRLPKTLWGKGIKRATELFSFSDDIVSYR